MAGDADGIPIPWDDAEFLAVLSEPMALNIWHGSGAATSSFLAGKSP